MNDERQSMFVLSELHAVAFFSKDIDVFPLLLLKTIA